MFAHLHFINIHEEPMRSLVLMNNFKRCKNDILKYSGNVHTDKKIFFIFLCSAAVITQFHNAN